MQHVAFVSGPLQETHRKQLCSGGKPLFTQKLLPPHWVSLPHNHIGTQHLKSPALLSAWLHNLAVAYLWFLCGSPMTEQPCSVAQCRGRDHDSTSPVGRLGPIAPGVCHGLKDRPQLCCRCHSSGRLVR